LRRPRLLTLALIATCAPSAQASSADAAPIACPVGVLVCPKKAAANRYALCRRNDLLDFFVPGLPTVGDRSRAPTDVTANRVESVDRSHYRLSGDVRVQRLDQLLRADFLTYDSETTDYTAEGHVRMQDRSLLLSAARGRGTVTPSTTWLDEVRYQLLDQRGNGTARTANLTDPDHGELTDGTYSTCDPSDRRWYLHGDRVELDHVANQGRAHDVTLYLGDVPFFWFPYLTFPLSAERKSGFLVPRLSYTSRRGLVFGVPYYLNLAPNYDATLTPLVSTERGALLQGQFRYLDAHDKTELDFRVTPHDDGIADDLRRFAKARAAGAAPLPTPLEIPNRRYELHFSDVSSLSSHWSAAIDIHHVSDKEYFQDYGDSLDTTATSLLGSSAYLNGRGEGWTAAIGGDSTQITQPYLAEAFQPYTRLPRLTFQGARGLVGDLAVGIDAEYVNFRKSPFDLLQPDGGFARVDALQGQRLDLHPYLAYPIETAAYFLRPELGLRYTAYDLRDLDGYAATNPGAPLFRDRHPARTLPIASLDAGLVFERDTEWFGRAFTQTLEPRLFYLRVPFRDQTGLPIFDTQLPTFDFPSLFRSNAFVGADRQSNANELTLAVTSRLIDGSDGDEVLRASIGQIRYFDAQRVQLPGHPEVDFSGSDVVAELDLRLNDRWELKWDQQYNPNSRVLDPMTQTLVDNLHHTDLSAISLEHRFAGDGVFNLSYRFRRGLLEQLDGTALYPLNERWSLVGRYYYSLLNRQLLEAFAGAEYDSCCVAMRIVLRRYVNAIGQINTNTGLYFELELKGLGATGSRTENFLRRAILGHP
jgi:LPS-assembly protein